MPRAVLVSALSVTISPSAPSPADATLWRGPGLCFITPQNRARDVGPAKPSFSPYLNRCTAFEICQELGQRFVEALVDFFRNYRLAIFNPKLLVDQVNPLQNVARTQR